MSITKCNKTLVHCTVSYLFCTVFENAHWQLLVVRWFFNV